MSSYGDFRIQSSPGFLQDVNGRAFSNELGGIEDALADRAKQAVKARFPLVAPPRALNETGLERQIPRAKGDTDASYAGRLVNAWTSWPYAGTARGVLTSLFSAGYSVVLLQRLLYAYSLDVTGTILLTTALGGGGWRDGTNPAFWSRFTVLFASPLPALWLAGGLGAVVHAGTGTPVVTAAGAPTVDYRVLVWVVAGGAPGVATFQYSTDNGQTVASGTPTIVPVGAFVVPGTGITLTFGAGTYVVGDTYSVAPNFNVPPDGSAEATLIKSIVNLWKPAMATVSRYVIHTSGAILGWPAANKLGLPPAGGTAGGAPLYLGGSTATYWTS